MDYDEASNDLCLCEKHEIGNTREEDKASHDTELEEGEFRRDEPFGSVSLVHKDVDARAKLSSSFQVAVQRDLVNTPQSMSPERGSHQGGDANSIAEHSNYAPLECQSVNVRKSTFHRKCSEKLLRSSSPSFHISSKERQRLRQLSCFRSYEYHHVLEKVEKVCSERLSKLLLKQNGDRKEFNILQKKQELEFFQENARSYKIRYERVRPTVRYDRIKLPKLLFCTLRETFQKYIQHQLLKFVKRQINDRNKEKRRKERWIFEAKAGYLKKYFDETSLTQSGLEMEKSKWDMHDYFDGEQQLQYLDMQDLTSAIEAIASGGELADSYASKNIDVSEPILENLQTSPVTNDSSKHGLSGDAADEMATIDSMPSQSYAPMEFSEKDGAQAAFKSPLQNQGEKVGGSCSFKEAMDEALEVAKEVAVGSENILSVSTEKRRRASSGDDASEGSCSRSQRKSPHGIISKCRRTALYHKEPAAMLSSSVIVNQREQSDNAGREEGSSDQTSPAAPVNEQPNINADPSISTQILTQRHHCDLIGQNKTHPYQPSDGDTCSFEEAMNEALEVPKEVAVGSKNTLSVSTEKRRRASSGDDASIGSCSRSKRKSPHEIIAKFRRTALSHKEPQAAMLSSSVIVNQREQSGNSCREEGSSDQTSSAAQVNEQLNINADPSTSTQILTQRHRCDLIGQNGTHPYQPSDGDTRSVGIGLGSPEASNVQPTNQMMTRSMVDQYMPEFRLQADRITSELTQVLRSCIDLAPSFTQATEQQNNDACSSLLTQHETQHQYCDQIHQTVAHQYQPSGENTSSLRTWFDSSGDSNVQQQPSNLTTAGSTSEQYMNESGLQSDPFRIELHRLLTLRDLMTKRHLFEKQKIILEREMAVAELKRKYDEQFHNLEMETLQKKKDIETLRTKVCKQQILAEAFQVVNKGSAGVASDSQRVAEPISGATSRTTEVSNRLSVRRILRIPAPAIVSQPRQPSEQSSTNQFLCQPSMITQEGTTNTSGRFAPTLAPAPGVVTGPGIASHAPAPRFRAFLTSLPASRRGSVALER